MKRYQNEDGAAVMGFILSFIIVVVGISIIIFAGRLVMMGGAMRGAVEDAVRAATIEQTLAGAETAGRSTLLESLEGRQVPCRGLNVNETYPPRGDAPNDLNPGGFVTIEAQCTLHLGDLVYFSSSQREVPVFATATERVDVYRGTNEP